MNRTQATLLILPLVTILALTGCATGRRIVRIAVPPSVNPASGPSLPNHGNGVETGIDADLRNRPSRIRLYQSAYGGFAPLAGREKALPHIVSLDFRDSRGILNTNTKRI